VKDLPRAKDAEDLSLHLDEVFTTCGPASFSRAGYSFLTRLLFFAAVPWWKIDWGILCSALDSYPGGSPKHF
jgi:hypothetical protein